MQPEFGPVCSNKRGQYSAVINNSLQLYFPVTCDGKFKFSSCNSVLTSIISPNLLPHNNTVFLKSIFKLLSHSKVNLKYWSPLIYNWHATTLIKALFSITAVCKYFRTFFIINIVVMTSQTLSWMFLIYIFWFIIFENIGRIYITKEAFSCTSCICFIL